MKYRQKSFSVPGSAGSKATCDQHGHTDPDVRGKCLRCSAKVRFAITPKGREALMREEMARTDAEIAAIYAQMPEAAPTDSEGAES